MGYLDPLDRIKQIARAQRPLISRRQVIALVPVFGAIAYVASDTMTKKGLGRLLVDQAAYKMPVKLYRRLGMARLTAPRLPQVGAGRLEDRVSPHEAAPEAFPVHADD